ncbi:MAG TPA: hypothetical protein VMN35_07565 [Gaiellaceae bacterium]|nr:hypothetical protein [Gaiellaceae bacterium]
MSLVDDLEGAVALAAEHGGESRVAGVIATEPEAGRRVYLLAFDDPDGYRSWLAVRSDGSPVVSRAELREAVSIAVLCEVAADAAGGGDLLALIARLGELRATGAPAGIGEAEEAARALLEVVAEPPQVASPARLDAIGQAARRLERELEPVTASPFAAAMRSSEAAVGELQREIEAGYRLPLT